MKTQDGSGSLKLKIRALKDPNEPADYLDKWKTNKAEWKFNKNLQNWLLTNAHDTSKVGQTLCNRSRKSAYVTQGL